MTKIRFRRDRPPERVASRGTRGGEGTRGKGRGGGKKIPRCRGSSVASAESEAPRVRAATWMILLRLLILPDQRNRGGFLDPNPTGRACISVRYGSPLPSFFFCFLEDAVDEATPHTTSYVRETNPANCLGSRERGQVRIIPRIFFFLLRVFSSRSCLLPPEEKRLLVTSAKRADMLRNYVAEIRSVGKYHVDTIDFAC